MEDKIRQWYEFLIDLCERTKAATILAEKIYLDFNNKSATRDIEIMIITSLYHSAAINLYQIFDSKGCTLSIYQFRNAYYGKKSQKPKFKVDNKALKRLQDRRNQLLAHADQCTLFDDNMDKLNLYIEDLKSLLKSVEDELFPLSKTITGASFGRINSTDEWYFQTTQNIVAQYEEIKDATRIYAEMISYMRKNCTVKLFEIIYGKGDKENGQAENGNP